MKHYALAAALGIFLVPAISNDAHATDVTLVNTPSGLANPPGSLVNGNIVKANGAHGVTDTGIAATDVDRLGTTQSLTALKTFNGGLALPTGSNPTGSNFYLDSNGALHIVNSNGDFQGIGAKFSGDATRPWFTAPFGLGVTESSSSGIPLQVCSRLEYYNGGSGLTYCGQFTVTQGKGFTSPTTAEFAAGATTITITPNANIVSGMKISGPGIDTGYTVQSYSSGTVTLPAPGLTIAIPSGTQLSFESATTNITPQNSTTALQGVVNLYTSQTGIVAAPSALNGYCFKFFYTASECFGGNFVARDQTGRKSSVSLGALITHEDDLVASGPDDNFTRIGNDSTFSEWAPSADGATTFFSQWRVRPNAATTHSVNPATLTQAGICSTMPFVASSPAESGGYGSFQHCINADGGESTGVYDAVSGTLSFNTVGSVSSGQPALVFSYGTNINAGQRVTGSGNIPPGTTVDAVYQCAPTSPLSGCGGVTNETLIVLSANLTGTVANNTSLTFTGVFNDGSYFNGIFSDAFASWTNQTAKGLIKAGTLNNTGTTLTLTGFGEDSTNTTGIDYGDINWKITTNTHGATLGEINLANAGVTIGSPTGGNEGAGSLNVAGTIYQNGVAVGSGTLGTTGSPANGNLAKFSGSATITNGDLSGDCTTSGTLAVTCSGLAPKANPTFAGIVTLPDGSTAGAAWTIATAMAMGGHGMTAAGALIGQATSGPEFFGASTASSTVPTFAPNRASANTGIGAQASGNISLIAGGTEIERITSSGIILEGGAYFSGATSGVTCSGSPTGSFASTNGIVTHC